MLKDVGMEVPKSVVNKEASIQQNRGATIIACVAPPYICYFNGVMHVIIVAYHHPLFCCMDAALFTTLFGASIPISFNILNEKCKTENS